MISICCFAGREDKLSADNRKVVDNYQVELSEQISNLFNRVASCLSQQNVHLQGVNKLSQSRLEAHNKVSYCFVLLVLQQSMSYVLSVA